MERSGRALNCCVITQKIEIAGVRRHMQRAVILELNFSNVCGSEGEVMAMPPRVASGAVVPGYTISRNAQCPFAKSVDWLEALQAHDMTMPQRELLDCSFCFCGFALLFLLSRIGLSLIAQRTAQLAKVAPIWKKLHQPRGQHDGRVIIPAGAFGLYRRQHLFQYLRFDLIRCGVALRSGCP